VNGPAVQDLWLFLAGSPDEMARSSAILREGYGQFCQFDYRELQLIEALRALRLMHYNRVDRTSLASDQRSARVPMSSADG